MSNQTAVSESVQENRTKYIHALRSGKYKQTKGSYYNPNTCRYCAVGVAFHTLGMINDLKNYNVRRRDAANALCIDIMDVNTIIDMNDEEGKTFTEIADALEENGFLISKDYRTDDWDSLLFKVSQERRDNESTWEQVRKMNDEEEVQNAN